MRILLVNLLRSIDRRTKMQAQFDDFGLPFEILKATDGRALTVAERVLVDHDRRKYLSPYPLTDNEIGCWLSHRRALESVAKGDDRMAVIVEDDTLLSPDFGEALAEIEKQQSSFDFIFLHRNPKKGQVFVPVRTMLSGNNIGRIGLTHTGCQAYVVSRSGAKKFMQCTQRITHAVDSEIHQYWRNGFDIYGLERPIVRHEDGGHSYIDETRGHDRPTERKRYPDADRFIWRWRRLLTRLSEGVHKRRAFRKYLH